MTLPIGPIATVVLPQVTAITLALAEDLIAPMKVIRERAAEPTAITTQEIHKARVIRQVHAAEQLVPMVNQTAALTVTNVHTVPALQAILTIAGITVTVDEAAAGGAMTTAGLAAPTVLQAVPIALQAAAVAVQATAALLHHADHVNYEM
jgi:hypothetical protein